jgi:hypothetical protein
MVAAEDSLETVTAAFSENLQRLCQKVQQQAQACVDAAADAVNRAGADLVRAADELVAVHNRTMDVVRTRLHDDAPRLAVAAFGTLHEAAHTLETLCAARDGDLAKLSAEIADKVADLTAIAARMDLPLAEAARVR